MQKHKKILTLLYYSIIIFRATLLRERVLYNGDMHMNDENLIIIGAGVYALVVKEIAESLGCFGQIEFADDNMLFTKAGDKVLCKISEIEKYRNEYPNAIVAIGSPETRIGFIERLKVMGFKIATLVSKRAYVSPSAIIGEGSVIEPMATVHTAVHIKEGCIISSGAVVNHMSVCERGVHVDCNATVAGNIVVPEKTKIPHGEVFRG